MAKAFISLIVICIIVNIIFKANQDEKTTLGSKESNNSSILSNSL